MKKIILIILQVSSILFIYGQDKTNISDYINSFSVKKNFSGTILIQKNSKTIYKNSFGLANIKFNEPNKDDTKYKIASITKAFTAVLVLQLYEKGRLDLKKTIKTYLPNYKGEGGNKITIEELLHHTSGMVNMDTISSQESALKNGMPAYQLPHTTEQIIDKYCSNPLKNKPGKVFDYDNAEYIILGKIIEAIYNKPYEQVLKEKILKPLKMNDSGMLYQYEIIKNLADTYFFRKDLNELVNDLPVYIENWYAAGAMYSTAEDLLKFSNGLFNHMLLDKESLKIMLTPGLGDYGCGVWIYHEKYNNTNYTVIKRPGRIMGANSVLYHIPDKNITIIILSNSDSVNLDNFVWEIGTKLIK